MFDDWIFRVCHDDGSLWTREEVNEYFANNYKDSYIFDFDCFLIDEDGYVLASDKCGDYEYFTDEDVRIEWNPRVLEG